MIKEIKLKAVYINTKNQDGSPLINKKGGEYQMVVIENMEGKKASCYIGQFNGRWDSKLDIIKTWKAGDTVKVDLEANGKYLNFSLPKKTDELEEKVANLELRVSVLEGKKATSISQTTNSATQPQNTLVEAEFGQEMPPDEAFDPSEAPTENEIPF